ncbi:MAG: hypothetical protein LBR86_00010 [Tannerella sp.]|nr:hypothetical protein [Tannerella sp.]
MIYRWAGGASLSVGTFEYTVYANPTVSTNFDGVSLYDYFYGRTTQFPGKVEFTIRGGSPDLEYSLTNFAQNTTPRRVYANGYTGSQTIALTPLDIQNLIPGSTIQFNEPHGCGAIMPVFGVPEVPEPLGGIIQRPIYIDKSVEAHATIIPGTGIHYVPSGKNFVFKVIPKEADADAKVTVTTDRKILPPEGEEDITYKIDDEGIWTVTIRGIQEALNVNISFAAPNSATGTAVVEGDQVWGTAGAAYITSATAGSVRIYGGTGALVKTVTYSSGTTAIPLPAGFYILSKGGSNYKVIVK